MGISDQSARMGSENQSAAALTSPDPAHGTELPADLPPQQRTPQERAPAYAGNTGVSA